MFKVNANFIAMEFLHHVSVSNSTSAAEELDALGVNYINSYGILTFDIRESSRPWPAVQGWIERQKAVDIVTTKFTSAEIAKASWLRILPTWHHGYPQPREDDFGYLEATYDLTAYCPDCGSGLKQARPFQLKAEPRWGRREILQLNWIFDEFFVTPELWERVFQPFGVACREVLGRKGQALQTVVQLDISETVSLEMDDHRSTSCSSCRRRKFAPHCRGYAPKFLHQPFGKIVRSRQMFGSGASSHGMVLIADSLVQKLGEAKGISLWPVAR